MRHHRSTALALATITILYTAQLAVSAQFTVSGFNQPEVYGTPDDDQFSVSGSYNSVFGFEGNDEAVVEGGQTHGVYLGDGDDYTRFEGSTGRSRAFSGAGNDVTVLDGTGFLNYIDSQDGNDVIVKTNPSLPESRLSGGNGVDVLVTCSSGNLQGLEDDVELLVAISCPDSDGLSVVDVDPDTDFITIDGTMEPIIVSDQGAPAGSYEVRICSSGGPTTEDDLNVQMSSVNVVTCGSGAGDPHFVGFDGHPYDYAGHPGTAFNVIDTPDTIVNALLAPDLVNGLTYMSAVGLRTRETQCRVAALEGRLYVYADEAEITQPVMQLPGDVKVEQSAASGAVTISSPELVVTVALHGEHFLDLTNVHMRDGAPEAIHGVLGQTAIAARGIQGYQGEEEDYIVSSLWADDFKFGRLFRERGLPAPVKPSRKMGELLSQADAFVGNLD